jgi:hypothetical protein
MLAVAGGDEPPSGEGLAVSSFLDVFLLIT